MDLLGTVALIGAVSASLVGLFSAVKLVTTGIEYVVRLPRKIKYWRKRYRYIILPTADDMIKYSVKLPERNPPSDIEIREYARKQLIRNYYAIVEERIRTVKWSFLFVFCIIIARLIQIATTIKVPR